MKLKRVKIYGFKTFADKTEVDLRGNVIAVVGPNGCGKSNIVDAVLWGLGESNSRALRAQTSQEVIFNGSARRKPVGFAEVSLLFDNEDGTLPIDLAEVSISRRLTRAGESTYQINRRDCRLKDIADLLADSGLGRAGYAIVGQSEIDQALAASAGKRRAWIDEAAGVMRYRLRRQEANRRLEGAQRNLDRILDLLREVEAQIGPVEEEARIARQARDLMDRLRSVEVGHLGREIAQAAADLKAFADRSDGARTLAAEEEALLARLSKTLEVAAAHAEALEARIEAVRTRRSEAATHLERCLAAEQVLAERLEGLDRLEAQLAGGDDLAARRTEAEGDLEQSRLTLAAEEEAFRALEEAMSAGGAEAARLSRELREAEAALAEARRRETARERHEAEAAQRRDRQTHIQAEIEGILRSLPEMQSAVAEARARLDELTGQEQQLQTRIDGREQERRELGRSLEEQARSSHGRLAEMAALEGRIRGLQATLDSHDGLTQGARAVMAAIDQNLLPDEYRPVGEVISVEADLAQAIETALGAAANDLICPDEGAAKQAIELLKRNRLGRATFQPVTLVRPQGPGAGAENLAGRRGVVGWADRLVGVHADFRPVIESILGRVLIVETLDDGLELAKTRGWSRLVTLDGEVIHASGAVSGGAAKSQGVGMVQRRAELDDLLEQAERMKRELDSGGEAPARLEEQRRELRLALDADRAALADLRQELVEAKTWHHSLKHELESSERARTRLQEELDRLTEASRTVPEMPERPASEWENERNRILQELAAHQADSAQALARRREAVDRTQEAREKLREAERRISRLKETEEGREKRAHTLVQDRERLRAEQVQAAGRTAGSREHLAERERELEVLAEARRIAAAKSAMLRDRQVKARESSAAQAQILHQAELGIAKAEGR
ncbi:MAG: AAA family ATPase, partial [Fimbriimonadaceae bacterium]|nr:AAA family ATPase [Fimbriimonadaceae bacterium]